MLSIYAQKTSAHLTVIKQLAVSNCEACILVIKCIRNAVTIQGKRIYFTQPGNYINGNNFNYNGGDSFVLKSGIDYTYFTMGSVKNVTIINEGGMVHLTNGFSLSSCENVTIAGKIFMASK
jgi:hypothetical protein